MKKWLLVVGFTFLAATAQAQLTTGYAVYWGDPSKSTTTYYTNIPNPTATQLATVDRSQDTLGFLSPPFEPAGVSQSLTTSTSLTGQDFLDFNNGLLHNNHGTYTWNQGIGIEKGTNTMNFNPDRGDNATPFAGENTGGGYPQANVGTLAEVFGASTTGLTPSYTLSGNTVVPGLPSVPGKTYKNMANLLDGEDGASGYYTDLLFGNGKEYSSTGDLTHVDVTVMERGGNSNFDVYGLVSDGHGGYTKTSDFIRIKSQASTLGNNTVYDLNSLEIGDTQPVVAYGISLPKAWANLVGFEIGTMDTSYTGYNGPDIVAVGVTSDGFIPEPAFYQLSGLLVLGGAGLLRIYRKSRKTAA